MSMNFGKINRSAAFDPTTAFPLDARSYFESLELAQAAAQSAKKAGSQDTVYYYGQTLVVVENDLATFYMIQTNNTLIPIGGSSIKINPNQFEFDDDGFLNLKIFGEGSKGQILSLDENNTLSWITPVDTYSKTELDTKIATLGHLTRVIVDSIEEIQSNYLNAINFDSYVFMIKNESSDLSTSDKYDEYIILEIDDYRFVEKVGSWEVNLENYLTKTEAAESYVEYREGYSLISDQDINKLTALPDNAEANFINSVATDQFTVNDRKLSLNDSILANKVDKVTDANLLLTQTDREILDALILEDDKIEISGKVNVNNVTGLKEWIAQQASEYLPGLSQNSYSDTEKLKLMNLLNITSVDSEQFTLDQGHLSIFSIKPDVVEGLTPTLNSKAAVSDLTNLEVALNAHMTSTLTKFKEIDDRLTWQNIQD